METMSEIELIKFEKHKEDLRKRVANNWQSTFEKQSRWSQPHIVNGEYAPEQAFNQLWVISRILPVGQHDFIVRSRKNDSTEYEWSIFNTMVDIRLEPIPVMTKKSQRKENKRRFVKENSVFADWKEDTAATLNGCIEHDISVWRI